MPTADIRKDKSCFFCANNVTDIDYKDMLTLSKFINIYKKILPRKRTGVCAWHQRKMATAIKRARTMALLAYHNK